MTHKIIKRTLVFVLFAALFITTSQPADAASEQTEDAATTEIEYFDDGSYVITVMEDNSSGTSLLSTTKTKSKTSTYYNTLGVAVFSVTVTGTFTYGSGSATCTSASVSAKTYSSTWEIDSKSVSRSGNKATATGTAVKYLGNIETQNKTLTVTLTCSSSGVFS